MQDVEGVVPIAGVIDLLEKPATRSLAPIELARRRMTAAQIPLPDVIVSGEDVMMGKPHPDCYLLGASRLG